MITPTHFLPNSKWKQMTNQGNFIEVDGYIILLTVKEAVQTFRIRRPPEHELRTCVHVYLVRKQVSASEQK